MFTLCASYGKLLDTKKQLKDIYLFCFNANRNGAGVLGTNITFKLCNMLIMSQQQVVEESCASRQGDALYQE